MKNYYSILQVTPSSSDDDIRVSYRKLAMQFHPDRNPDSPEAEEKFKEISEAYGVLIDPVKRREYDSYRASGYKNYGNAQPHGGFQYSQEDILRDLFNDPRFSLLFTSLLKEFQRSGFRSSPSFIRHCFFGGRGGFFVSGLFFFASFAGPAIVSGTKKLLNNTRGPAQSISNTLKNLLNIKSTPASLPSSAFDTIYHIPLSPDELKKGKWLQVALDCGSDAQMIKVKVPAESNPGSKLRVKGKGRPSPDGPGDLYLLLEQKLS